MRVRWAATTHPGRRRASNEDAFCARPDLGLFVVADGMGGHVAGEVASKLAVDTIEAVVAAGDASAPASRHHSLPERRLEAAFERASVAICRRTACNPSLRGMATTASAVLITDDGAAIGHVGDSRIYLWRDSLLQQLTHDHSWVAEQVSAGLLTPAAARQHPWRNVVTRALSASDPPEVELSPLTLQPGDRLLISSDGLHGVIADDRVSAALASTEGLDHACQTLIEEANAAGGPDNITTLMLEIDVP
ncbi:MAG: serine/threonine-protein phosphatase [Acidobacteria bacterium]|nr:serine/threonine-protein phosphatase [Acidobacteriota bacterium]